jgi:hypothetical protein
MTWLRILAGAWIALWIIVLIIFGVENSKQYHGSYRAAFGAWISNALTCLAVILFIFSIVASIWLVLGERVW